MRLNATDYRLIKIDEALARISDSGRMVSAGADPTSAKRTRMLSETTSLAATSTDEPRSSRELTAR